MPKVKNPLLSAEARGGIGGLVYNTWRGINYVKTNTSPTGQGTQKRLAAQALLTNISRDWQSLTNAQRTAWSQYAIDHPVSDWTGSPKRLTGMNWFTHCNINLARVSGTPVTDPPADPAPDAVTGFAVALATGDITLDWTAPTGAGFSLEIWEVGPISAGRTPKIQQAHFKSTVEAATVTPLTIEAAAAAGRWTFFVRVLDTTQGLVSTWVSGFVDAT